MMKNQRNGKGLALLLCLVMLFAVVPTALAQEDYVWDGEPAIVYRPLYSEEDGVVFEDMMNYIVEQSGAHLQLNFVSVEDYPTTMRLKLAGGEAIDSLDLIYLDQNWVQFYALGQLKAVDEVFKEFAPTFYEKLKTGYDGLWSEDGQLYALPNCRAFRRGTMNSIRQDWLDKLNMAMPETLDEYIAYLEGVKQNDMNGNGDPNDEYGIAGASGMLNMFCCFFTGGVTETGRYLNENGEVCSIQSSENYIALLDFVKLCVDNGYCPKEWDTMEAAQFWDLMVADRVGTIGSWYSSHCSYMERLWKLNPEADYVPLLPFDCVEGVEPKYPCDAPYASVVCFPSTGAHLEEVAKFIEWYTSDIEHMLTVENGIPGIHWEWADEENRVIRILDDTYRTASNAYYRLMLMEGFFGFYQYESYESKADELLYKLRYTINLLPDEYYQEPFDFLVSYDYTGTPVEDLLGEGKTLFEEGQAAYLSGGIDREEILGIQQQYIEMEDTIYRQVRTAQYNKAMGIE